MVDRSRDHAAHVSELMLMSEDLARDATALSEALARADDADELERLCAAQMHRRVQNARATGEAVA